LGSEDFVERVLRGGHEELEQRTLLKRQGFDLEALLRRVADYYKIDVDSLRTGTKERSILKARFVLCYLAVRKSNMSATQVALNLISLHRQ
jgi:chromosomal replication initiation ATPase DnaA